MRFRYFKDFFNLSSMFLLYFQCLSKGKITFIMQLGGHQYSNDIDINLTVNINQSLNSRPASVFPCNFTSYHCRDMSDLHLPQQQLMSILARTSPAVGKNGKPRLVSKVMTGLTLHSLLHYITHTTK